MGYARSQTDIRNFSWFGNDKTRNTLVGIRVANGNIRGIYPCKMDFSYPISTIVGENGSGKSTILALAACAFHNFSDYRQFSRKKKYFTYGDFFTFAPEETGLHGIEIEYTIRQMDGDKANTRRKKPSGKWNDFNTRESRRVIYMGVNRIVPPSESSAHCSYRRAFLVENIDPNILSKVKTYAGRIFEKNYDSLSIHVHNIYRLFLVNRNGVCYSGFNMGAGENAVISILLELLNAGPGSLLVVDEIELGLHAKAQKEFIEILKEECESNKCQIICSTHSNIILGAIPPEGRYFIQNSGNNTIITPEISTEYAFGKLAKRNSAELDVFVEDEVGEAIIKNILIKDLRERIVVHIIGSVEAVLKQMAARYREGKHNYIAFLDGDMSQKSEEHMRKIRKHLEDRIEDEDQFKKQLNERLCYLPGDSWPELSIIEFILKTDNKSDLSSRWDIPEQEVNTILRQSMTAGKHKEFYSLGDKLSIEEYAVRIDCIKFFKGAYPSECELAQKQIKQVLHSL